MEKNEAMEAKKAMEAIEALDELEAHLPPKKKTRLRPLEFVIGQTWVEKKKRQHRPPIQDTDPLTQLARSWYQRN